MARLQVEDVPDLTPAGRIGRIRIRGRVHRALSAATATGNMAFSTSELSTLTLSVLDPELAVLEAGLFAVGTPLSYAGYPLLVTALAVGDDPGVPQLEVTARTAGAARARRIRGALTRRDLSPTDWVRIGARQAGCSFVGEPSPHRRSITRKGAHETVPAESEYEVWQRLASELGFICFESAGVVYFAKPTWLLAHLELVAVAWPDDRRLVKIPGCRRSVDDPTQPVTVDLTCLEGLAGRLLPGVCARLSGVPTFNGPYIVTGLTVPLDDAQPCTVNAATPVDPTPQPPAKTGSGGAARASTFVAEALTQVGAGDPTPAPTNPAATPPKSSPDIDGGELVAWAAARAGATGVDRTPAGLYSQASSHGLVITVAAARRLRGALLFRPGVAGISLGDGRCIEPSGDHYRIAAVDRGGWTGAARCYHITY